MAVPEYCPYQIFHLSEPITFWLDKWARLKDKMLLELLFQAVSKLKTAISAPIHIEFMFGRLENLFLRKSQLRFCSTMMQQFKNYLELGGKVHDFILHGPWASHWSQRELYIHVWMTHWGTRHCDWPCGGRGVSGCLPGSEDVYIDLSQRCSFTLPSLAFWAHFERICTLNFSYT